MLKIKLNNKKEYAVELDEKNANKGKIDGKDFEWDAIKLKENIFHVIHDHRSYNVEILKKDAKEKTLTILVNNNKYTLNVRDKYDELLIHLGFDKLEAGKINNIKAPMPGLVLDVLIAEGSSFKKGDSVIVLEAMKMENILKAPSDGTVKKINVGKGTAVEKNQVLITMI